MHQSDMCLGLGLILALVDLAPVLLRVLALLGAGDRQERLLEFLVLEGPEADEGFVPVDVGHDFDEALENLALIFQPVLLVVCG